MFRCYMWTIFRLRFNLQISYTRRVVRLGGWGERGLVVSIVGTMTPGCFKWIFFTCKENPLETAQSHVTHY